MKTTLDLLVTKLFDYAGMYAPASLSFSSALSSSARFPETLHRAHMCNTDLVLGVSDLNKLTDEALIRAGVSNQRTFFCCTLGTAIGANERSVTESRLNEISTLQDFNLQGIRAPIRRRAVSYECKLDENITNYIDSLRIVLRNILSFFSDERMIVCIEPDLSGGSWQQELKSVCSLCCELNQVCRGPLLVLKVRGSGPSAINMERLSYLICEVCEQRLDIKATAGLHHPIIEKERYNNDLGFLNLCAALMLRRSLGSQFSREAVLQCLNTSMASDFIFAPDEFRWKEFSLPADKIAILQQEHYFSIGSCSLNEPDSDLVRLFP